MSANIPVEASFWAEALIKLKSEHPKSYQHLEEIRSMQPQPSTSPEGLADELLAVIDAKINALNNPELPLPSNIRNGDTKDRIQMALDNIWKAVKACKSVGDLVTNIDPLHAGVAWIGVSIILQVALNGVEQNTAALEGLAQISPLVVRYAKIEELYIKRRKDDKLDEAFKKCLIDLYVAILRYQVSLAHHLQRRKFVQYARSLPKLDDWGALLKDITSKDAECRTFTEIFKFEDRELLHGVPETLNLLNTRMDALFLQTSEIYEHHRKRANLHEQKDILNWISTVVPRQEHRRMLENSKLDREYANAGQWLFHHPKFQSWYAHRNDTAAIWLRGPVGTGKSSLVCLVIEHCLRDIQSSDADKEQIAYFYCTKKQGEGGSDPKTILRSLVRQLAWSGDSQSILKPIKDMYDESQLSYESGESRLSVTACISLLTKLMSGRQNTAIIIDALDECSNPRELLSNLRGIFTSAKSGIRFLFSSRMMNFDVLKEVPECAIVEVSSESHTDIEFYVNTEVDSRRGLLPERTWTRELEDRLVEILTRQAQGMFRWVQLQLEVFFSPKSPLRHSKDIISKLDRLDVDVSTPELNTVYDEIYEMNAQHPQDRTYASKALEWVMCSPRPLTTAALVDAISIDLNGTIDTEVDETYLMQICSNFLVTDARGRIQFAHLSVREYLTSREANFKIKAHAEVAKSCLAYVLHTQYADISGMRRDDIGEGFGEYAVWYWPVHCSESGELRQQDDSLRKMFESFMSIEEVHESFVRWMHFLCSVKNDFDPRDYKIDIKLGDSKCSPPSPWSTACAWGFPEVLRTSLQTTSDLERRNVQGYTGLFLATRHGHLDVVQQFIENGVNIETTDKYGYTALHTSIEYRQRDVMRLLLDNGASCMKSQESDSSGYGSDFPGFNALHLVAKFGDKEMMELILQKGVDIDTKTPEGETALHIAARFANTAQVRLLMKHGACIESRTLKGETALHIAAEFGDKKMMELILQKGVGIDTRTAEGETALHIAAQFGDKEMMELILQKGVGIDTRTAEGETALYIAAKCGHTEQVRLLMKYGACIESKTNRGRTAISEAAIGGHEEIVRILMDEHNSSEDVKQLLDVAMVAKAIGWNARDLFSEDDGNDGQNNRVSSILRTAFGPKMLHLAVSHGNEETVALLLNRGVGVHVRDDLGRSPLLRAIDYNNLGVAELLLDHGANIEASEGIKRRAIRCEAPVGNLPEAQLLLENAAHIRVKIFQVMRARQAMEGHLRRMPVVRSLPENGADIDVKDSCRWGVLHCAARQGRLRIVKLLLEIGADIDAKDHYGDGALHYAARMCSLRTMKFLLDYGADIEAEDDDGNRALHLASYGRILTFIHETALKWGVEVEDAPGSSESVQLLLEKGAIIEAENNQGRTALDLAVYSVNVVAVELLLEKGAIPRRVYDDAIECEREKEGFEERWSAIQDMIDAWSESASDYR